MRPAVAGEGKGEAGDGQEADIHPDVDDEVTHEEDGESDAE